MGVIKTEQDSRSGLPNLPVDQLNNQIDRLSILGLYIDKLPPDIKKWVGEVLQITRFITPLAEKDSGINTAFINTLAVVNDKVDLLLDSASLKQAPVLEADWEDSLVLDELSISIITHDVNHLVAR